MAGSKVHISSIMPSNFEEYKYYVVSYILLVLKALLRRSECADALNKVCLLTFEKGRVY